MIYSRLDDLGAECHDVGTISKVGTAAAPAVEFVQEMMPAINDKIQNAEDEVEKAQCLFFFFA